MVRYGEILQKNGEGFECGIDYNGYCIYLDAQSESSIRIYDIFIKILADLQIFQGSDFGPNDQVYCEAALRFYFDSSLNQVYNGDKGYTSHSVIPIL